MNPRLPNPGHHLQPDDHRLQPLRGWIPAGRSPQPRRTPLFAACLARLSAVKTFQRMGPQNQPTSTSTNSLRRLAAVLFRLGFFVMCLGGLPGMRALARDATLVPSHGSILGGNLVFVDLAAHRDAAPGAEVTLQFGSEAPVPCAWDERAFQWRCQVPPHAVLETVETVLRIAGEKRGEALRYTYTSPGKNDAPVLEVRTKALEANAREVRKKVPEGVRVGVVLKNGDPVGALGRIFESAIAVDYFCVPKLQDGVELREAGIRAPIMILYVESPESVPLMLHYDLEPAALSPGWVARAGEILGMTGGVLKVHLWVDTGMGREGVLPSEALALGRAIAANPQLHLSGIGTHFGCIDSKDLAELRRNNTKNNTVLQKSRLDGVIQALHAEGIGIHALIHAGTSEVLRYQLRPLYYDLLRVGSLFFENPPGQPPNYFWTAKIQQIKTLPKGWCIDYGCTKKTRQPTPVGLLAHVPERSGPCVFSVRGKRVEPLIADGEDGMLVLDLSGIPEVKEGEEVTIEFDPESNGALDSSLPVPVTFSER